MNGSSSCKRRIYLISMKVSDYIVQFLAEKGIKHVFGYPGGSVANLMDSLHRRETEITAHVVYHEQAAAFAACAYAQTTGQLGVAYATGGPGATNLITGIGHAFYDSIPVLFLTGNVNTHEAKHDRRLRQRAFQESDIISVVRPLTKFCAYVSKPEEICYYLQKACSIALEDRPGPVLLDLPMNVQRAQIDMNLPLKEDSVREDNLYEPVGKSANKDIFAVKLKQLFSASEAPCLILGNGIKLSRTADLAQRVVEKLKIPYVTSMISVDVLADNPYYFGFLGSYGMREANFIASKSDLIISVGSRMDSRQVGAVRENFAKDAEIVRIDIDAEELEYKVHEKEYSFCMTAKDALEIMAGLETDRDYSHWISICGQIRQKLSGMDDGLPNEYMRRISHLIPENTVITTDVGQNQVWVAQSFQLKKGRKMLFSGGMGAMGHALPAAIGAYYGSGGSRVFCICGDGGLQMNIQELQYLARENIPVKIIVMNNFALGMIRHFQEMYFDKCYFQTNSRGGYNAPDFDRIAEAYGLHHAAVASPGEIENYRDFFIDEFPALIEVRIFEDTYLLPKLEFGKPIQDQWPLLDRKLLEELAELK